MKILQEMLSERKKETHRESVDFIDLQLMYLLQHLVGDRRKEIAEDDLILAKPGSVRRVWGTHPLVIRVQKLGGGWERAIDVACGAGYAERGKNLSLPEKKIGGGKLGGDEASGGRRNGRGRRPIEGGGEGKRS